MASNPESRIPNPFRALLIAALAWWVAAGVVYGSLRAVYGERPAFVHVRWAAPVDEAQRAGLERRYGLTRGEVEEGRTWGYYVTDLSTPNIRALVTDPSVEDTHQIHRTSFRIWRGAPRAEYVGAEASWTPRLLEWLTVVLLAWGAVGAGLATLAIAGAPRVIERPLRLLEFVVRPRAAFFRRPVQAALRWFAGRVPPASAEAVALFRMAFGAGVMGIVLARPVSSGWVTTGPTANSLSPLQEWAMRQFVAAPAVADWLGAWIVVWGVLLVAGAMARTAFVMLAAGVVAWSLLFTTRIGAHPIGALMLALVCLVWSRWGDAWSVDAWLRRRRGLAGRRGSPREYGYTLWAPGLVLGVSFVAAAFSKVREGPGWIVNGTVKYHFLTDSREALVDWGLRIGAYPTLAILLSLAAVAIEALVIVGALSHRYHRRAAAGIGALAILAGFALFQGLIWPAWWLLLLSFLPWHRVPHRPAPDGVRVATLRVVQVAVALLLVLQQVAVSALKVEMPPLLSTYDMYSTTYANPQQYENAAMAYWMIGQFEDGSTAECRVSADEWELVAALAPGTADLGPAGPVLDRCEREHPGRLALARVTVEGRTLAVDWDRWRVTGQKRIPLAGPIPFARPRTP